MKSICAISKTTEPIMERWFFYAHFWRLFMFCPYAVNRHTVTQTVYEYNEDGTTKMHQTVDHNNAEFVKCKEQECGAWRDGKCCYQNNC